MKEFTREQLVAACVDAAKAGAESERASIISRLQKLIDYAHKIEINQLTINALELALDEVKNV